MDDKQILSLLNGFTASGIAELELDQGDLKLCLRRFPKQMDCSPLPAGPLHAAQALPSHHEIAPQPSASGSARGEAAKAEAAKAPSAAGEFISSPLVATFYRSPGPDSPPFAEVGKKIKAGQTLCILEAMKNMNELQADFDFEVVKILPESGSLVEFGQPLFEVRRV